MCAYPKTWHALTCVSNFLVGTMGKLWYETIPCKSVFTQRAKTEGNWPLPSHWQFVVRLNAGKHHHFSSLCKGLLWASQTKAVLLAPNLRPKWKGGLTFPSYLSLTACQLLTKKSFATYRPTSDAATTSIIFVSLKLNGDVEIAYSINLKKCVCKK